MCGDRLSIDQRVSVLSLEHAQVNGHWLALQVFFVPSSFCHSCMGKITLWTSIWMQFPENISRAKILPQLQCQEGIKLIVEGHLFNKINPLIEDSWGFEALTNENCTWTSSDIKDNKLGDEEIKYLCKASTDSNCKLQSLDLRGNRNITDVEVKGWYFAVPLSQRHKARIGSSCYLSHVN